ncbi:Protein required for meiotic chromosome segregation [Phaffia rhodozyma]|uniref:Protein required for meiotic chromosome segregation n=1 Tax=Phaffia rhodozyma TaxID=264483 RepID=A0A0F7SUN4_PHARH|nr:Protein required for meiotic chromosome segregation [Phaffia rhodozyma]
MTIPPIDLVIQFSPSRPLSQASIPKPIQSTLQSPSSQRDASKSEYRSLIDRLRSKGLQVTSRRARPKQEKDRKEADVFVLVRAKDDLVQELREVEREQDFLQGVTTQPASITVPIKPAERLRLIHELVTGAIEQGGLAITANTYPWPHVVSIFALHDDMVDQQWKDAWVKKDWKVGLTIEDSETDLVLDNHGQQIALYFTFLKIYTRWLIPLAALSIPTFFIRGPYSSIYGSIASLWGLFFVEFWRIEERTLSYSYGTHDIQRRPRLRAISTASAPEEKWWKRDGKLLAVSWPALGLCAIFLVSVLTALFIFEAFIASLYNGPFKQYIGMVPTILFSLIVPRILAVYRTIAEKLTLWEDYATEEEYENALTTKTFALNSIVAFMGLFLSAYCYIPFGDRVMDTVDYALFATPQNATLVEKAVDGFKEGGTPQIQGHQRSGRGVINLSRLQDQMFAFTVTNQVINAFTELGLPILLRKYAEWKSGEKQPAGSASEKTSAFAADPEEAKLLQKIEKEAALPEYTTFTDYSELVTQFGYVCLWSICWPLASMASLVNNYFELRSDALKICLNVKRPIPSRVSSVGPWLEALTFIAWMSSFTNSTLALLFNPGSRFRSFTTDALGYLNPAYSPTDKVQNPSISGTVFPLILVAFGASHLFLFTRTVVRYLLNQIFWEGSQQQRSVRATQKTVRANFLKSSGHVRSTPTTTIGGSSHTSAYGESTGLGKPIGQSFWDQPGVEPEEIGELFKTE